MAAIVLSPERFDAVIFDLDGVITRSAGLHARAWKRLFDELLQERSARTGEPFREFSDDDYRRYVDGKRRLDGLTSFLVSRGMELPEAERIALAQRKDGYFLDELRRVGADVYKSSVWLLRGLLAAGFRIGLVSSSRNTREVLARAGLTALFGAIVDGVVADEQKLAGKPAPAMFLEAARRLGVEPARAVVVEDAQAGVEAGKNGGFGLVIGVDRAGAPEELRKHGADCVVSDLAEVTVAPPERRPSA